MKAIVINKIKEYFLVAVGTIILAFGYACFIIPNSIVIGGMTGISIVLNFFVPNFDIVLIITILTVIFFLLGLIFLGREFAAKTIISSIIFPFTIFIVDNISFIHEQIAKIDQLWIVCIMAALCEGFGLALVFKNEGSTGGVDILAQIISEHTRIEIFKIVFYIDFIIVCCGLFSLGIEKTIIGLTYTLFANICLRRFLTGSDNVYLVQIISNNNPKIQEFIHTKLERGTTIVYSRGGYSNENKEMIEVLISKNQIYELKAAIKKIDKNAFVVILSAGEVLGNGFKPHK